MTPGVTAIQKSPRLCGLVSVDGRTYPLKSSQIDALAEGGLAATTFQQTYDNPYDEPLEVFYTLPLPADGVVTGYTIRIGSRVIRGEVRKRVEAREQYRKALFEGRTAALLEQERADTFTQSLGSLPPRETAEVTIEVLQPLAFLPADESVAARWEYRFPTVAGVRYEGAEGRVPDAGTLEIDRSLDAIPVKLNATIHLADGTAAEIQPHGPGLDLDFKPKERGVAVLLRGGMKLDRDLVIRWSAAGSEVGLRLVEGGGLPCDPGRYALVTITPPAAFEKSLARDLTLLVDASGSMAGRPLEYAKTVAEDLVRSLAPSDRFEILTFSSSVRRLEQGPVEASSENIAMAVKALEKLQGAGSTEMAQAMVEALRPLRKDSQRQVILLSDGYIGFEGEVIGEVLRSLVPGARLHTVGIGSAPNRTLTQGAARAGRGIEVLVGNDGDAHMASRRLLQATLQPILTDLEVKGSAVVEVAPRHLGDVMGNRPLLFLAEIASRGGSIEVRGNLAGSSEGWTHVLQIASSVADGQPPSTTLPLGALFGKELIEDVELELAIAGRSGNTSGLEHQIEKLGLRHGIASRMTSLIAISEDQTVDPKNPRRRERLPVEIPADVSAEGLGLAGSSPEKAPLLRVEARMPRHAAPMEMLFESLSASFRRRVEPQESASMPPTPRVPEIRFGIKGARILVQEGKKLVVEFEVPVDHFMLPRDGTKVSVRFDDGTEGDAHIIGAESTGAGPHDAGLTVRLAMTLRDTRAVLYRVVGIGWAGRTLRFGMERSLGEVELIITNPEHQGTGG